MKLALEAIELGKAFRTYRSELWRAAGWFGFKTKPTEEKWVLRGISFRVAPGESIGIVGQNGAGKSTLLKLLTGTLRPTEGQCRTSGRVSAILELGMGFNPEFTGRQNIYHAAGLLGFTPQQIEAMCPEIEEFAEIGDYFDQPARTYSSGMAARVAFALATAIRPDVLIVDEVLSVGDAYFQHKSFERIRQFRRAGTALLVVSHDKSALLALCDRAILLDHGRMIKGGDPSEVLDYYNALIAEKENKTVAQTPVAEGLTQTVSGSGEAQTLSITLLNARGEPVELVRVGEKLSLHLKVRANQDLPRLIFGYVFKDRVGQAIFGTNSWSTGQAVTDLKAGEVVEFTVRLDAVFGPGSYSVSTALTGDQTHLRTNYEWRDLALLFTVQNLDHPEFLGTSWIPPHIEVKRLGIGAPHETA